MSEILFSGGPCDGEHQTVFPGVEIPNELECKGTTYRVYEVATDTYLALLPDAKPADYVAAGQASSLGIAEPDDVAPPLPPDPIAAFRHFWNTVGRDVPQRVNNTATIRRGIRGLARRG